MIIVKYDSNNSGGSWWLDDNDWVKLEQDGWLVLWKDWFGAKAKSALLLCKSEEEAIERFEKITGQLAEEEGCSCCGQPHYFESLDNINSVDYYFNNAEYQLNKKLKRKYTRFLAKIKWTS